jgi:hypothetical protein
VAVAHPSEALIDGSGGIRVKSNDNVTEEKSLGQELRDVV